MTSVSFTHTASPTPLPTNWAQAAIAKLHASPKFAPSAAPATPAPTPSEPSAPSAPVASSPAPEVPNVPSEAAAAQPAAPSGSASADDQLKAVLAMLKAGAIDIAPHVRGFRDHRLAALALLATGRMQHKEAQFCGNVAVLTTPPTQGQSDWLRKLLLRENLPLA